MANTTNYSFNLPTVGANLDSWGGLLNNNWTSVDSLLGGGTAITGIDINGGTIDGTVIGGTTTAAITGTTVTATEFVGPLTGNVTGNVTGDVTGALTGNASTATQLATPRAIAVTSGPITTSSLNFDGSGDVALTSLLNYDSVWPINSIYISTNAANPSTYFPFTTWEAFGEGKVIIGAGTHTDTRSESKTFVGGDTGGAYQHLLVESEIPTHNHEPDSQRNHLLRTNVNTSDGGFDSTSGEPDLSAQGNAEIQDFGGDTAHNNTQPYIAVYMWKRIANP